MRIGSSQAELDAQGGLKLDELMLHPSKTDNPAETIYVAFANEEKVGHRRNHNIVWSA
jgi:hypothetical protein